MSAEPLSVTGDSWLDRLIVGPRGGRINAGDFLLVIEITMVIVNIAGSIIDAVAGIDSRSWLGLGLGLGWAILSSTVAVCLAFRICAARAAKATGAA